MNSPKYDTEDCWALRHKAHDLIESGTKVVSLSVSPNIDTNPLPSHGSTPLNPTVSMIFTEEFLVNPSQLIGPSDTTVWVHLLRNCATMVAPINYSLSSPFLIGSALVDPQFLIRDMDCLIINPAPQQATKLIDYWGM